MKEQPTWSSIFEPSVKTLILVVGSSSAVRMSSLTSRPFSVGRKAVEEHRSLLVKAEARAAELRSQVDKTDRDLTSLRKECNQLRNELEDERSRLKQNADKRQSEISISWSREREDLRRTINELRNRIEVLQHQVTENEKIFVEKESRLREEFKRKKDIAVREAREKGEAALELVKEEEKILRNKIQELTDKLEKTEISLREAAEKARKAASEHRREKEEWSSERESLETEIRSEVKKREKAERDSEQLLKQKEEEVLLSKERVVALEREQRRLQMQLEEVEDLQQKIKLMEQEASKMKEEYDHLTARYDQLEDDFVKTKAKLVQEKEQLENSLNKVKREYNELSFELNSLKDTYKSRQDNWIKEKLDMQERMKELNRRMERLKTVEQERRRLQDLVDEKETLIESYKKEEKHLKEERDRLRKRVDDFTKAMESRDRPIPWSRVSDNEDSKLSAELESTRRDYEGRMTLMSSEITSMQSQIASLVEERDNLKSQLSSAERNAEEMRTGSLKRERARHREEAEIARRKVQELRFQMEDLREQLDDSLLENKNLKLQIETDKNAFEIQLSELKSKINQLEEQKIMESTRGQTRNIAKTRLELTWEKERGELQHLLSESQKLVSDLRSRLEQTELEREKEKQAVRKQMLEMRSSTEKDHQDSRRKMSELHSSLLEIRESHAKLRGMYDRMKKEREILLKEREEWRIRLQVAMQMHSKINEIVQDVEKVSAEVSSHSEKPTLPMSPEFKETIQKVKDHFVELQKTAAVLKEDERLKRTTSFRRAVSAQEVNKAHDPIQRWNNPQRVTNYPLAPPSMIIRPPPRQKSLNRKSLSLDHTLMGTTHEQRLKIWESEGESVTSTPAGSLLSLGGYGYETDSSLPDSEYRYGGISQDRRRYRVQTPSGMTTDSEAPMSSREGSVDPGGSTESVPIAAQQHRTTLKEKLKMLRRTKSIDVASGRKIGADDSSKNAKEEKEQSLRSKISKVLKKPLGRSFSDSHKSAPALPPKGAVPDVIPSRPTAEKPLSASRGELSTRRPASQQSKRPQTPSKQKVETPV
ncbi:trichohyalin-like [Stegodyphus dumicola]|uniref:trichohyalin-like n=1 Tax=Stegodyphus dumicola TaxID=202533 RepID=UPI0015AEB13B|nr:trichohyalin-like [Stegodyphus dumicola]